MTATALQSLEADLDRLERQRLGYALALASSQDGRARARHERTLARLDEEIAALQEAAGTLVHASVPSLGVPVVDRTTEFPAEEFEELPRARRPAWIVPAAAVAIVGVAATAWLVLREPPAPPKVPTVAPASVIITSPVPPDSHR